MAKRIIDWTIDKGNLCLCKYNSDKDAKADIQATFDLKKIYPTFDEFSAVQSHVVVYGAKQILADSGAGSVGDLEAKVESAKEKWGYWLEGKLAGPRANSTGNAENKKILDTVKTASKVVSLEGLMMKKLTFPETFTKEDQTKLDEFMALAVKASAPKTKK